jgi:hypothetical protein
MADLVLLASNDLLVVLAPQSAVEDARDESLKQKLQMVLHVAGRAG